MTLEEKFTKTFEDCLEAAKNPQDHVLVAHMWEDANGKALTSGSREKRFNEVDAVLRVMGGDSDACYNDNGYFLLKDNFPNRLQRGCEEGLIGVATCPVLDAQFDLFTGGANTGILLKSATPVFVSYGDAWSLYYDNISDIPDQDAWNAKCEQTKIYGASDNNLSHSLLRDDPEGRDALAGKLGIFNTKSVKQYPTDIYSPEFKEVLDMQIPEGMDAMPPYLLLDPLSSEVHEKAQAAYNKLTGLMQADPEKYALPDSYQEVDVNASLQHAAGIIVYNPDELIEMVDDYDFETSIDDYKPKKVEIGNAPKWSEILESREYLAIALYQACVEHGQLSEALKEKNIDHTPTIIIQQPYSENHNLVHFPPTQRNKQIVEGVLKKKGYDLPKIDVALQEQKNKKQAEQGDTQQTHPLMRQKTRHSAQR